MSRRYTLLAIALLLAALLAAGASAAPPAWAKKSKTTLPEPVKTAMVNASGQKAGSLPETTNATAEPGLRVVDWGAISVAIAIVGALIGWYLSKRTRSKSASYLKEIDAAYRGHRTAPERLDAALSELRDRIGQDFEKGKLTDQALSLLDARIDKYAKEARVDAISTGFRLPKDIKRQIKGMLDDGVITEEEYDRFTEMDLTQLSQKDYERLTRLMRKWKGK